MLPWIVSVAHFERHRSNKLRIVVRKTHALGHYANNLPPDAVDADALPDRLRAQSEALTPEPVIDNHHGGVAGDRFVWSKKTPRRRMNAQSVQCVCHHLRAKNALGCVAFRHVRLNVGAESAD